MEEQAVADDAPHRPLSWQLVLSMLVDDVARLQRVAIMRLMRSHSITRTQWLVLIHLSRTDGITQRELATQLEISEGGCTAIINRMVRGGWIARCPCPVDRRQNRIFLAPASEEVLRVHRSALDEVHERVFSALTPEDGHRAIEILSILRQDLSELSR